MHICFFVSAFRSLLENESLDEAFIAFALSLPTQSEVLEKQDVRDYDSVKGALGFLKNELGIKLLFSFEKKFNSLKQDSFELDAKSMGQRSLKSVCLSYLSAAANDDSFMLAKKLFENSTNMNDEISALKCIVHNYPEKKESFVNIFYTKWKTDPLVMQKWLGVQASAPYMSIEDIKELEKTDVYDSKIPNYVRSILRNCIRANPCLINKEEKQKT